MSLDPSAPMYPLRKSAAWSAVSAQAQRMRSLSLNQLFAADEGRPARFSVQACGLNLDFSKQRIDAEVLRALLALAQERGLSDWTQRLFAGELINHTENRAAMHMALRAPRGLAMFAGGEPVSEAVHAVLDRMEHFAGRVRKGDWRGATGDVITDVVNIGIGGSDLGPRMVCAALGGSEVAGPRVHFVANVDATQLVDTLAALNPAQTLFVVTSKTFTTQETMANARSARRWLVQALGDAAVRNHFVAVSTNLEAVAEFGISAENCFAFWDWVGGRYSVWSAVGLSVMLRLGAEPFRALLAGAQAMDTHFREAPAERNLPSLMALLALWNHAAMDCASQVVAPYAQRLCYFVAWLQQLEMESNGKGVMRDGRPAQDSTPAIWGDVGSNSQHAFFQMLHQGTAVHAVDFILPLRAAHNFPEQQRLLLANALAQAAALMRGKTAEEVRTELQARGLSGEALAGAIPHRVFPGNRPSSLLLLPQLDAFHLGALMALYEHRTFALSVLWGVNAFDQWGVELGKQLTAQLLKPGAQDDPQLDASTRAHLHHLNLA